MSMPKYAKHQCLKQKYTYMYSSMMCMNHYTFNCTVDYLLIYYIIVGNCFSKAS